MSILKGHILITGASSGIGEAFASLLAPQAESLILVARRQDRLEVLAARCRQQNPNLTVTVKACDLAEPENIQDLVSELDTAQVPVTVLINNAGLGQIGLFEDADQAQLERMLMVNVVGLTLLTRLLLPRIIEAKGGVLNVSSGFGLTWMPLFASYVGSKHYVSSFNAALRAELAGTGVIVSQLCPGPVATEFEAVAGNPTGASAPAFIELSAEQCAKAGLKGFKKGRELIIPGFWAGLSINLGRLSPRWVLRIFYGILGRSLRKRLKQG